MGCDIHAHFEIKLNGTWKYYSPVEFQRDYKLFTKLAGVRGPLQGVEKTDSPRGLPGDVTEMTKIHSDYFDSDGHSHSWITSKEYIEVMKFMGLQNDSYLFGNDFESFYEYREDYPEFIEDFRLVFWFDN